MDDNIRYPKPDDDPFGMLDQDYGRIVQLDWFEVTDLPEAIAEGYQQAANLVLRASKADVGTPTNTSIQLHSSIATQLNCGLSKSWPLVNNLKYVQAPRLQFITSTSSGIDRRTSC